jgi:WhiB family redox-sensing transcriptional regulator
MREDLMPERVSLHSQNLSWVFQGACVTSDLPSNAWFPLHPGPEASAAARAVCARCLVRTTCLGEAMLSNHTVGIWGGTDQAERRRATRKAKRHA